MQTWLAKRDEFSHAWSQLPRDTWYDIASAIRMDCDTITGTLESHAEQGCGLTSPVIERELSNAKYVKEHCREDAIEDIGEGVLHPNWTQVRELALHLFTFDFFPAGTSSVFTFPNTRKLWDELTETWCLEPLMNRLKVE